LLHRLIVVAPGRIASEADCLARRALERYLNAPFDKAITVCDQAKACYGRIAEHRCTSIERTAARVRAVWRWMRRSSRPSGASF
jgi:hypothetical protein